MADRKPNAALRRARLARCSPSGSGRPMSRQELAEAVAAHLRTTAGRAFSLSAGYVGKLERGVLRWPGAAYRQGFRAVLGAATDAALGFYITRRTNID